MSPAVGVLVQGDPPARLAEEPEAALVAWRDLRGRAAALAAAAEERAALAVRLEGALEARRESARQGAALDDLRHGVELKRACMEAAVVGRRRAARGVERRKAVLLIAFYLDVPLRYPLRFGGSRSFVSDCLSSAESASVASAEHLSINNTGSTEYPLFLECKEDDSTKASYAIYLLHKERSSF